MHEPPRFQGVVTRWDDAKGFGFIAPDAGGEALFFHRSAFAGRTGRPAVGLRVAFAVGTGAKGKRALRIEPASAARPQAEPTGSQPRPARPASGRNPRGPFDATGMSARRARGDRRTASDRSGASLLLVVGLALFWLALAAVASPPPWTVAVYLGMSVLTYLAYALDKSAARRGAWRTQESTLHLLALCGGWPGALLAQRRLRHKTQKASFQSVYRATVVLNIAALLVLSTSAGRGLLLGLWAH